jgi:hypothetical protein
MQHSNLYNLTPSAGWQGGGVVRENMARTRLNPRGLHLEHYPGAQVVQVGLHGTKTHLYNRAKGDVICKSGRNAGRYPAGVDSWQERERIKAARSTEGRTFFPAYHSDRTGTRRRLDKSQPAAVTCYRCAKLAEINISDGRAPWVGEDGKG